MKHKIPSCPVTEVDSIQKVAVFDEIKFTNDMNKIRFLELAEEVENNYMLLSIDGTIFKYDLASKELLFSFKTVINLPFLNIL